MEINFRAGQAATVGYHHGWRCISSKREKGATKRCMVTFQKKVEVATEQESIWSVCTVYG